MEVKLPKIGRQSRCSVLIPNQFVQNKPSNKNILSPEGKKTFLKDITEDFEIQQTFEEINLDEELKFVDLVANLKKVHKSS